MNDRDQSTSSAPPEEQRDPVEGLARAIREAIIANALTGLKAELGAYVRAEVLRLLAANDRGIGRVCDRLARVESRIERLERNQSGPAA